MLEVNNIIDCSNLKIHKYNTEMYRSNATSHATTTRHIIKSHDSIGLVWEVALELHLLSPSNFNSTILVKCPHIDQWQKTYFKWIMLRPFLQVFFVEIVCHKALYALRWGCDEVHYLLDRVQTVTNIPDLGGVHNRQCGVCSQGRLLRETVRCVPERRALSRFRYPHRHCPAKQYGQDLKLS